MWVPDVASWSEHFRVYAVDLIGEPRLSVPARPPLPSGAYPLWLGDVLDALGVTRASVAAVSLGGWLALDFATRHPERVERLTLLTPAGVARTKVAGVLGAVLLKPFGRWGKRKSMEVLLGPDVRRQQGSLEFVELLAQHYRYRREPVPVIDDAALRGATMPILAVLGGRDAFIDTPRTAQRLSRLVPSATVRVLPGIGHLLPAQTAPILEFLRAKP
jgi:pimeloyl-ACP methyl ester carboxylesterase